MRERAAKGSVRHAPHDRARALARATAFGALLVGFSSAFVLAACGPSRDAYPFVRTEHCPPDCDAGARDGGADAGPSDAGPPVIPPEPLEDWDTTGAGPLTGVFAVEVVVQATVVVDVETRQLFRVRVLQVGRHVRLGVQPCAIDLVTIPGVADLHFSPGAEAVVRERYIDLEGDFLSAADPIGATFAPPPAIVVLGADLAMPETDPLPTASDPARASDDDGDGNPGVTIDVTAVVCSEPEQAYAALRASLGLSGTITDVDAFDGDAEPRLEQSILGYTAPCLSVAATLTVAVRPGSVFHARRMQGEHDLDANGNWSCPEIAWWSSRFFGDYWLR